MRNKLAAGVVALVLIAATVIGAAALTYNEVAAQNANGYEYGYFIGVPRLESYEIDLNRWAGAEADKKYLDAHVFVYEQGQNNFDRQINSLRKLNELAENGWELVDADAGVVRRKR